MKLLVDGVFFQLHTTGIARVWSSVLPRLEKNPDLEIVLLNRGNAPSMPGIERVDFPSYKEWSNTAADSFLIEKFCKALGADVFASTYYTTPITVPSVLVVYDMIPEVFGFDLNLRHWQEKQLAIGFASKYVCISEQTRLDLDRFHPGTIGCSVTTHCGLEHDVFRPQSQSAVNSFKKAFDISKPYYILVGSREQYKNAALAFKAMERMPQEDLELLCIGGEPEISPEALALLPPNVSARRIELRDVDLACAYSGAEALVYPSLYEGFGLPVVEAMACGCPVITTRYGSLAEVIGDAATIVSGHDVDELQTAMIGVRQPENRREMIRKGLAQASRFEWDTMAEELCHQMKAAFEERTSPARRDFIRQWKKLRTIQAAVDPS